MACENSCGPSSPCNRNGCPNAAQAQASPESQPADSNPPMSTDNQGPGPHPNQEPGGPASHRQESRADRGTVRIGVGNTSSTDISIEVTDNLVTGGRHRVHLGSGNHAAGANTGFISGNVADADDLLIGVDNHAAGGDNDVQVYNNDFRGFSNVRIGVGNYAGGSNKIVVGGPRHQSGPTSRGGGSSRAGPPGPPSPPQRLPPQPPSAPLPPQPPAGLGRPYGPPYGPGVFGPPGDPYYYAPGPMPWGYAAGPGPNPGGMQLQGYNMQPPFGHRPPPQQ